MKFIDICAGIGGFRSGLEQAGHECVGYVEIDKYARKSYEAMYDTEGEWTGTDITEVKAEEMPQADLWCFGFPCQDISVAGSQRGLSGKRSGIFYSIIGLLKGKSPEDRPKWLLVENVKNLLSINGGREFTEVLSEISEAGYDCEWHLVNSKDYGVPQNRERVFIVGLLRGASGGQLFPLAEASGQAGGKGQEEQKINTIIDHNQQDRRVLHSDGLSRTLTSAEGGGFANSLKTGLYAVPKINVMAEGKHETETVVSREGLSKTLKATDYKNPVRVAVPKQVIPGDQAHRVYDSNGTSVTIKVEGGGVGAKTGLYTVPKIKTIATGDNQRKSVQRNDGIARALTATDYKKPQPIAIPCLTPERENKRQNGRRFKENGDPMFTLTAQDRHGVLIYKDEEYYIRRLTPKECFRLQGFTDEQFEKAQAVNSNTQLYKQAGNAVTVNVAYEFGKRLKEIEEHEKPKICDVQ